jgi:hypothetical protein
MEASDPCKIQVFTLAEAAINISSGPIRMPFFQALLGFKRQLLLPPGGTESK